MGKNKQKNIEKEVDIKEILEEIKAENTEDSKDTKNKKDYIEYDDLKNMATAEHMTKPLLFKVIKVETMGIKVKLDRIIEVPVGKYICLFTNNIIKIMNKKELEEISIVVE